MGDLSSCIRHAAQSRFFMLFEDFLAISGGDIKEACAHRVLETRTNDRLVYLREQGIEPTIDDLWITPTRRDFSNRTLGLYDGRAFHEPLKNMERKKFVRKRYIKIDQNGEQIRDADGQLLVYRTYREAQEDKQNAGAILKQYLYCFWFINKEITRKYPDKPPTPSGDDVPPDESGKEETDEETSENEAEEGDQPSDYYPVCSREGNPQTSSSSLRVSSIVTEGMPFFPGGKTNTLQGVGNFARGAGNSSNPPGKGANSPQEKVPTAPGKSASNKILLQESSSRIPESTKESAPDGAVEAALFENDLWNFEAIMNLAAIWLPPLPTHLKPEQLQKNQQRWEDAARHLLTDPSFTCYEPEQAINRLIRQMRYMTDPNSPCSWRKFMAINYPNAAVRLWHVANNAGTVGVEMDKYGWYPEDEQREEESDWQPEEEEQPEEMQSLVEEDRDPEPVMTPELPAAQTEPLAFELEVQPEGMDAYEADQLAKTIQGQHPLWIVKRRRHGLKYLVEIQMSNNQIKQLYSPTDWQLLQEASRLSFQERIARMRATRSQFQKAG